VGVVLKAVSEGIEESKTSITIIAFGIDHGFATDSNIILSPLIRLNHMSR
jgi:hypothetical protein